MIKSKSLIAIPPGYTIKEQLDDRGLTQKEFALRMELSEKHVSKLINGDVLLTTDVALRLEMVLGIPARFWLNLESIYREKLEKIKLENDMDGDIKIASLFPYQQMVKNGWIGQTTNNCEKVINLRKYFEVNRLVLLSENEKLNVLYRRVGENDKSNFALMAWAQQAKLKSREYNTKSININDLKKNIDKFRKMTREGPENFCNDLINELSNCGIALVLLPHLNGTFLHGATFYYDNKIVLGLTVRGKDSDKFWFSFFHEIGHIILGHINNDYYDKMENEADEFARNILIPDEEYNKFVKCGKFKERDIISFADKIEVDYGIVVGRLQKDKIIPFSKYGWMKTKYNIS